MLSLLILFQSCYSYKTFDFENYQKTNKPKKFEIELTNSRKLKGRILEYKNDSIVLETRTRNESIKIPTSSILKIRKRKFSYWKTGGLIFATYIIIMAIILLNYNLKLNTNRSAFY